MAKRFIGNVKGVGVSDFSWEYYLSSSSAVLDGGSWSATPPTLGNNKYLWMRSKVTLTDGSIQYTVPVCEGVWEEIYGIYAIGDKVDGALSDVTDLKSRMTAEEGKIQPLSKGGTGKTTRAAAMNYMQYIPASAISFLTGNGAGDTTANWVNAGTGLAYISTEGLLENQPMKYGWLYNFTSGSVIVAQQFIGLDGNSPVWYRSGNASGWYPGSKNWVRSLDEKNGVQIKKVWQNASPSSAFPPQDVAIAANEGNLIGIEFESQTVAKDRRITWIPIKSGFTTELVTIQSTSDGGNIFVTRRAVTITNAGSINFDKGYYRYVGASNNRHDGYSIPTAVYIAKGVL